MNEAPKIRIFYGLKKKDLISENRRAKEKNSIPCLLMEHCNSALVQVIPTLIWNTPALMNSMCNLLSTDVLLPQERKMDPANKYAKRKDKKWFTVDPIYQWKLDGSQTRFIPEG